MRKLPVVGVLAVLAASIIVPAAAASESGPTPSPAEPRWIYVPVDIDGDGLIEKVSFLTRDEYVFGSVFAPAPPYLPLDDTPGHYFGDYVGMRSPRYAVRGGGSLAFAYAIDHMQEATLVSDAGGALTTAWDAYPVRLERRAELDGVRLLLTFTVANVGAAPFPAAVFQEAHGFDDAQAVFEGDAFPGGQLIGTDHPGEEDRPLFGMVYAPVPDALTVDAAATFNPSLATWSLGDLGPGQSASVQLAVVWSTAADPATAHDQVVAKMVGQKRLLRVVPCSVDVKPETFNLRSQGRFTAFVAFPPPFDTWSVDVFSVRLAGAPAVKSAGVTGTGIFTLKFERTDAVDIGPGDDEVFALTGRFVDGTRFACADTVRVIDPPK